MPITTGRATSSKQVLFWNIEDMTQVEVERWPLSLAWPSRSELEKLMDSITLFESFLQLIKQKRMEDIDSLLKQLQERGIYCRSLCEIREYLQEFPDLIDVIPIAVNAAQEAFPEALLVLEVYQDPEIDDRYLALYVRLHRYDELVIHRLEEAEARFIDLLSNGTGWLQLTTDFREPGVKDAL